VEIPGLRRTYLWMVAMAAHPRARVVLFCVSVAEAFIFPIPKEVMMVPMVAAQPAIWWRVALLATIGSAIGGAIGWFIGWALYETVAAQIIALYGFADAEARFREVYADHGWLVVLVAAVTPIPDKVLTIVSGMVAMSLPLFVVVYFVARAIRHFTVAYIAARFGPPLLVAIERRLALVAGGALALLVGGFLILSLL
jgi:membrane protein YqaA with SNARE-associated domain